MGDVEDTSDNFELCLKDQCGRCPSFPHVDGEALYCARGHSKGKVARSECVCPDCPVWVRYGLAKTFYCDR